VTNQTSFNNIKGWISQIKENLEDINILLIGNKIDCKDQIKVKTADGKKLASESNIGFIETSSKMNVNVNDSFLEITQKLLKKGVGKEKPRITLSTRGGEKKKNCCKK
jgi:Ras-related protein Rab-1A